MRFSLSGLSPGIKAFLLVFISAQQVTANTKAYTAHIDQLEFCQETWPQWLSDCLPFRSARTVGSEAAREDAVPGWGGRHNSSSGSSNAEVPLFSWLWAWGHS